MDKFKCVIENNLDPEEPPVIEMENIYEIDRNLRKRMSNDVFYLATRGKDFTDYRNPKFLEACGEITGEFENRIRDFYSELFKGKVDVHLTAQDVYDIYLNFHR